MDICGYNRDALVRIARKYGGSPSVYIRSYGCQQNVADSERIGGMLSAGGFTVCSAPEQADFIIFNTCAVRGHAEDKVFGHIGRLKKLKEQRPNLVIAVGGCMVEQETVAGTICRSYPFVDLLFNTNRLRDLPELLEQATQHRGVLDESSCENPIVEENLPIRRTGQYRAFVPIMYGCDNFCTYCIVPYVRGRERSRTPLEVEKEVREAVEAGFKDIMLLGQNVNSYGRKNNGMPLFPDLLRRLCEIEGDFKIRFMTSHPKDATAELFEAIADSNGKICKHVHLPVQSGSDRILSAMNRRYASNDYRSLIQTARGIVPDITFTSDIIVGFPNETPQDFEQTVRLIEEIEFYSLFTFIYSKREGTSAAKLEDPYTHEEKAKRLIRLNEIQSAITEKYDRALIGKTVSGLVCDKTEDGRYDVRLENNAVVLCEGTAQPNTVRKLEVKSLERSRMTGFFKEND